MMIDEDDEAEVVEDNKETSVKNIIWTKLRLKYLILHILKLY